MGTGARTDRSPSAASLPATRGGGEARGAEARPRRRRLLPPVLGLLAAAIVALWSLPGGEPAPPPAPLPPTPVPAGPPPEPVPPEDDRTPPAPDLLGEEGDPADTPDLPVSREAFERLLGWSRLPIRILDGNGRPVPGTVVKVQNWIGGWATVFATGTVGEDGGVAWKVGSPDLAERAAKRDRFAVLVVPPARRLDLMAQEFPDWEPAGNDFVLALRPVIEGRVVDLAGRPVADALVHASIPPEARERDTRFGWHRYARTGPDGEFAVGRLPPGPIPLEVLDLGKSPLDGRTVTVEAGTRDALLRVEAGARAAFRIAGWEDPMERREEWEDPLEGDLRVFGGTEACLTEFDGDRVTGHRLQTVGPDGRVVLLGLREDRTYSLWIGPFPDGLYAWSPAAAPSPVEREVPLRRGGTVRGTIEVVRSVEETGRVALTLRRKGIEIRGEWSRRVNPRSGEAWSRPCVIRGLPEGPWTLRVEVRSGDTVLRAGELLVHTGTPFMLRLD